MIIDGDVTHGLPDNSYGYKDYYPYFYAFSTMRAGQLYIYSSLRFLGRFVVSFKS
jgi:hypothetical protein